MCRNAHDFFVVSDTLITFMACNINDKLMTVTDRFLKYVTFDTESSETTGVTPSTPGQRVFAEALVKELEEIGLEDITLDDKSYLMATLPANTAKEVPTIGFIAHLDTSPDMSGKDVEPRIVSYEGGDIVLCAEENVVLSPLMFPELDDYKGQDIIVTNGKTLLGADDKGGVAAIIAAMKYLKDHPEVEHGKIRVGFTPDEEDKMLNASLLAVEFASWLPVAQRPEHTTGYEGFFHLTGISGTVEEASLSYIIRDHVRTAFERKKELLHELVKRMNEMHPGSTTLELRDQYYNMREVVEPKKFIVDLAFDAMKEAGVTPLVKPIRGGTDGARLSFMGLPCPNIFAGGLNFHGRYEFLPVKSLEKSMETIVKIAELLVKGNYTS